MCRIRHGGERFAWLARLLPIAVLLMPHPGWSQDSAAPAETPPEASPRAGGPKRRRSPGKPVRLAVLTVAVHTPILVRAYDRFREQHGDGKLEVDLWVEQQWAESPRPLEFGQYDMILALRCSIPGLAAAVSAAAEQGAWVVSQSDMQYRDCAVLLDDLPDLAAYYRQRGADNMVGLYEKICERFEVPGVTARLPVPVADAGIYHPDASEVFADGQHYWKWYQGRPGYDHDAPKVGIFVYNTLYLNDETDYFTQLIRGVEQAGASPVLGFWFVPVGQNRGGASPLKRFFDGVDVVISSSFRLTNEKLHHEEALLELDVPVLNSIILNVAREEWSGSRQGIPANYLLNSIVSPEFSGLIEPTVIAGRQPVTNPNTGQDYFRTVLIDDNYRWQVRRALAWATLRRTAAADRRIAILYYNHSGGKQNIGASYLNVTASLEAILADLAARGYRVEGAIDRQAIVDSMLAVGRNAGQWAPGELDALVRKGAVLWPVEEYLAYYDRLPEPVKQQISRQWGQPPGDLMTVARDGGEHFVLPAFQLGNVVLAPQPARAASQQQASLYHDPSTWPTHQYLAFYFWLRQQWRANAVVHLGRHGTLEFLPGKSSGLSRDDPPALVLGDLPNIYPYIVDGIGEAVAAKRRGQAVVLTHATPPLTGTGLYGELARLQELTNNYGKARDQKQTGLQAEYYRSILQRAGELGYACHDEAGDEAEQGGPAAEAAEEEQVHRIEHWLASVQSQTGPRGLHTLGKSYSQADAEDMVAHAFRDELDKLRAEGLSADAERTWLAAAADADPGPPGRKAAGDAAAADPPDEDPRDRISATLWHMRHNRELDYLARALDGRFVPVGPPGDPLSNPGIFPTGRNPYQYNSDKLPTREAWELGKRMAEQTLDLHRRQHGGDPGKLSVTLWANTMLRTHGALESEILYLLGLEPVWNRRGDVEDVKLVSPLGRPRVDVVMTVTGMYRDSFPEKMLLLDKAVRLAHEAPPETGYPNHVQINTDKAARDLAGRGIGKEESRRLALLRIFGAQTGVYGTGVDNFVKDSHNWSQRTEVASQYLERMSYAYSGDGWAEPAPEVFRRQLRGVQGVIHGRSSNLYGVMDLTESFEYQGALALTIEQLGGQPPDLYVNDLVGGQEVHTAREAVVLEQLSRYQNPEFIRAMMAEGYDGARYFSRIADNQFGWDVVSDAITADDWRNYAEIYLDDKYELGLREFFEQNNPHALQNTASRVLETHRKGLQELDAQTLELAARVYVETVARHGAACAAHICAGGELNTFAEQLAGASAALAEGTLETFRRQLQRTGNNELTRAGASDQPAAQPQPVEGRVLSPPPPPVAAAIQNDPPATAPSSAAPKSPPSTDRASSETAKPEPDATWLAAWLVGILSVSAFVFGMLWRGAPNRRSRQSGAAGRRIGRR
ncbi:MAG: cobaltochelatase subunit CobN [Pirellulaceae bacterium]|jgi:cobaltochelatase CobN|nr:cobaltochelatase subunit CobN [Thermoguttaceae bacterium]NLZ02062.1 cobaltochelatase subunit CobN [Pirellulaceae bacterium]